MLSQCRVWLQRMWWSFPPPKVFHWCALLLGAFYYACHRLYRTWSQRGCVGRCQQLLAGRPLIIVGNVTVGGNGKTPVLLAIAQGLRQRGYTPAVLSRGFGVHLRQPYLLMPGVNLSDTMRWPDEPCMLVQAGFPVAIYPNRYEALSLLLTGYPQCDAVLSDDGLQYFPDGCGMRLCLWGSRGAGNHALLPLGPLREPLARLASMDAVIYEAMLVDTALWRGVDVACCYERRLLSPRHLISNTAYDWDALGPVVDAIAGIADPEHFFAALRAQGLSVEGKAFDDHHRYDPSELASYTMRPLLMTEKDAVKCRDFALNNWYYVPLVCILSPDFWVWLEERLLRYAR